jgi:hypothetical protein
MSAHGGIFGEITGDELIKYITNCYAIPQTKTASNNALFTTTERTGATVLTAADSYTATTAVYAAKYQASRYKALYNCELVETADTVINLCMKDGSSYVFDRTSTINDEIAAINENLYTPVITTESGNLELRMKLTEDFGLMAIGDLGTALTTGATASGFYFSTDANVKAGTKVAGAAYNDTVKVYSVYTGIPAAKLDTVIYFAAYVTVDGVDYLSEARTVNLYEMAEDLIDGYYGDAETGVLITDSVKEMALYAAMCDYYAAYVKYLDSVTPA